MQKENVKGEKKIMKTKEMKRRGTRGITLIALVVTIVVLLILAGTAIAMLTGDSGIMTNAQKAKMSTELAGYKEEVELYKAEKYMENIEFEETSLTAGKENLFYNTQESGETGNIKTIIPDISDVYIEKLEVIKGKLLINTKEKDEIKIAQEIGIEVNPYDITEDGVLVSSDGNLLLMDEETGSLTIPETVTAIGEGAFTNLEGLKTIIIPSTVKRIEQNAFKNNTTLENVIIQEKKGEGLEYIGSAAFSRCSNLKTINLPDTITTIESQCFRFCTQLSTIKLPVNLTVLTAGSFQNCTNLKTIELPQNLKRLDGSCLMGTALSKIKLPPNLSNIAGAALAITTLQEIDTSESNYFEYKNGVLYTKDFKTLITAVSNVTNITMENKVETIKGYSFTYCNKLSTIHLTENVQNIEDGVFTNSNLKGITVDPNNDYYMSDEKNNLYSKDGTILYRLFDTGNVTIRDGVKNIKLGALISGIKAIILPESYVGDTTSGWGTFPTIEYLYLPKNVNSFNKLTYLNVKNIEVSKDNPYFQSINNEYILSKDGTELYWVKSDLTEVNIPESIETIKKYSLMQVKAQEIELPEKIKKIETGILNGSNTKKITIESQISEINKAAFAGANNLSEVIIHKKNDGTLTGSPWGCPYGDRAIKWDN